MTSKSQRANPELLDVYLNDHLAGSRGGLDLARRLVRAHRGRPAEDALRRVAEEIAEDRETLLRIMGTLRAQPRRFKVLGGWLAEKAGRLKPSGRLVRRSPLSSVLELELMSLGVQGKAAGWRALRAVAEHDHRLDRAQLDQLLARAQAQFDTVEELRMQAVHEVLVAPRRGLGSIGSPAPDRG